MYHRLLVILIAVLTAAHISPVAAHALDASQCFPTVPGIGNCIDERFTAYWTGNGALPVFGYPITPLRDELNADTHLTYPTQWFERNRFEHHPEYAAPYDVLLGRLGAELLQAQGRDWHTEPDSGYGNPMAGTCLHFATTNRDVCGPFLDYWQAHGLRDPNLDANTQSVQLFGLPLTGVKLEKNPNGATVLTQWFERARFEWHPEVGNHVLLGLLGTERRCDRTTGFPDLHGRNLSGCSLLGVNFVQVSLAHANLMTTNLTNANLTRASLYAADLSYATLTDASLYGADLSYTNLTNATLNGTFLTKASLRGASLYRATLTKASLYGADLSYATLSGATLTNATLTNANLDNANLTVATLTGVTGGTTATTANVIWNSTICPDGTNSNNNGNTCAGHGF